MGKKLIIKGADFTENGIISGVLTFYNDYSDAVLNGSATFPNSNQFYMLGSDLSRLGLLNKTVRFVKLYAKSSGTITIGTYSGSGTSVSDDNSYQVTQGVNIITLRNAITLTTSRLPVFTGSGILSFWTDNNDDKGFKYSRIGGTASTYANYRMPVSFGALVVPNS